MNFPLKTTLGLAMLWSQVGVWFFIQLRTFLAAIAWRFG